MITTYYAHEVEEIGGAHTWVKLASVRQAIRELPSYSVTDVIQADVLLRDAVLALFPEEQQRDLQERSKKEKQ